MRIAAFILALALFVELASPNPLQSPKGAELFPLPNLVQIPPLRMSITASNEINYVKLAWTPSVGHVDGYYVYWGTESRVVRDYPFKTDTTITNKAGQRLIRTNANIRVSQGIKYYYAASAYSFTSNIRESDYSEEVSGTLPYTYNTITLNWIPPALNTIMVSTDLITWRVLTNSLPPVTFLRTKPIEFYRLKLP